MYIRLSAVSRYLEQLGLRHLSNVRLMLSRMAGTDNIAALITLADVAEPASLQIREEEAEKAGGIQTSDTPLNRMVDAVLPKAKSHGDSLKWWSNLSEAILGMQKRNRIFAPFYWRGVTMTVNCELCFRIHSY